MKRRTRRRFRSNLSQQSEPRINIAYLPSNLDAEKNPALMPAPSHATKSILQLLMATVGLALASRDDAKVELLPSSPTTVVISVDDKIQAAFILPISHAEAERAFGVASSPRDQTLEQLWELENRDHTC
jgi:hypothetical protein